MQSARKPRHAQTYGYHVTDCIGWAATVYKERAYNTKREEEKESETKRQKDKRREEKKGEPSGRARTTTLFVLTSSLH